MGGSALKQFGIETERFSKIAYDIICQEVSEILNDRKLFFSFVEAYREKESFGDLDVVINSCSILSNITELIDEEFHPRKIFKNGNTYSFDYKNFQIDFIIHSPKDFYSAVDYYKYSPCGNLVGKIAHQFDLTYGHEGLKFFIRENLMSDDKRSTNKNLLKEVVICNDTEKIHKLFGLDHYIWNEGFDTEEEIFKWITKSHFFNPDLFSFENMNHQARTRDRKRPDYNRFVNWLKDKNDLHQYQKNDNKHVYLNWILEKFPNLKYEIEVVRYDYYQRIENYKKFNGNLVKDWTGKEGIELGKIIKNYKESINPEKFDDFIDSNDTICIKNHFMEWYQKI